MVEFGGAKTSEKNNILIGIRKILILLENPQMDVYVIKFVAMGNKQVESSKLTLF